MIFPIGDDQVKGGFYPAVSYAFIIVNVFVFVFLQLPSLTFTMGYSVIPMEILGGVDLVGNVNGVEQAIGPRPIYFTLLFSMFMHGGWMHLIGNMLFLWIFGDNIEATIGSVKFAIFYILGGVVASFCHIISDPMSVIPSLGASGAIAAVMGAYLVMYPRSRIKMLILIIFRTFRIPAFVFLGFWILQNLWSGVGEIGKEIGAGTAWWAHIGGFFFGVAAGFLFKKYLPGVELEGPHEYHSKEKVPLHYTNKNITDRFENY